MYRIRLSFSFHSSSLNGAFLALFNSSPSLPDSATFYAPSNNSHPVPVRPTFEFRVLLFQISHFIISYFVDSNRIAYFISSEIENNGIGCRWQCADVLIVSLSTLFSFYTSSLSRLLISSSIEFCQLAERLG